jgi:alkylation response protein AidB-like acyl-CoA dehydrogenase
VSAALLPQYSAARSLEQCLGDPRRPDSPLSFAAVVEADEHEELPAGGRALLEDWGLHRYSVPRAEGGSLASCEEGLSLIRAVARRDLSLAVDHARSFLAAAPVWVAGTPAQARATSDHLLGGGRMALGLTERDHGSDLLATELTAVREDGGWRLTGEKWLINGARESDVLSVFARTGPAGGPRGFSLFLLDRRRIEGFECLPRVRTHGLRGADLSGFRLRGAWLPAQAVVGQTGAGLEVVLQALMVTRTLVAGLSLGAGETALAATLDFARHRVLYGHPVAALPHAREALAGAFADLLVCDALATVAARRLHIAPQQAAVGSAVVKYLVPTTVERLMAELGVVLGARHYLREGHWSGIFQKMLRDGAVTSLFDGSTVVTLQSLAVQLRQLTREPLPDGPHPTGFDLAAPLPELDWRRLELTSRGQDDVLAGLALLEGRLPAAPLMASRLTSLVAEVKSRWRALRERVEAAHQRRGVDFARSVEAFDLARDYCVLHAAAAALQLWLGSRHLFDGFFAGAEWLALGVRRLLRADPRSPVPDACALVDAVAGELCRRQDAGVSLGLVPVWP